MTGAASYVVVARYRVHPGAGDIVARALRQHGKATRDEFGCLAFAAHRGITDSDSFAIYEEYRNDADWDVHQQTPHYQEYVVGMIKPLLLAREVNFYRPLGNTD